MCQTVKNEGDNLILWDYMGFNRVGKLIFINSILKWYSKNIAK